MRTEKELVECYGKKRNCPERERCELGECCLNLASEDSANLHFQKCTITDNDIVDNMISPGSDKFIFFDEHKTEDAALNIRNSILEKLNGEARSLLFDILGQIADLYFICPNTFDALLRVIFKGQNQSDIARERNVTRQCINQRLHKELGILQKRNGGNKKQRDHELENAKKTAETLKEKELFLQTLSIRDYQIWKFRFQDGCTAEATAKLVGCDIRTVFRVAQILRRKFNTPVIKSGRPKKKK